MWLASAIPLSTVHSNSLLYFLLFWETHDLVWEIISVSEKRMKNCIVKIIDNVFEKWRKWFISFKRKETTHNYFWPPSQCLGKYAVGKYITRAPLGDYFEPPLVFLRYLLNQCRYHHQTCSTRSLKNFTHCVKIWKVRVAKFGHKWRQSDVMFRRFRAKVRFYENHRHGCSFKARSIHLHEMT